ncbi:hypothetical protein [Streptomyces sp. CB02115]|uniref:hypothetical protein n=1 Tax=Streptomyces sp. CB02115 TaxID=1703939 RepID=UPI00093AE23A|nr:hypothetical protein [Streptomyces sp. CB02115]OKJ46836.1 hypothetical protein AMK28_37270 [Streptomyces sp. CB02115]
MNTMPPGGHQDQPIPELAVLNDAFEDFLAQTEHELACRRREVRALRLRARRQRRREVPLRTRAAQSVRKVLSMGLVATGTISFGGGGVLFLTGDLDAAKDAFAMSAAAWGAAGATAMPRS